MGLPGCRGALLFRGPVARAGGAATGLSGRDGPEPAGAGTGAASIPIDTAGPRPGVGAWGPVSPQRRLRHRCRALVEATIRAALPLPAAAAVASGPVIRLTQGVLRSMFLFKLRTVAAILIAIAGWPPARGVAARGAGSPAAAQPGRDPGRTGSASDGARRNRGTPETGPPPRISPGPTSRPPKGCTSSSGWRLSRKAITKRSRHGRGILTCCVNTWTMGSSPSFSPVPGPAEGCAAGKAEAADPGIRLGPHVRDRRRRESIYRDIETSRMRFLKAATDKEVKVPNVGPNDHRSIVTPEAYLCLPPEGAGHIVVSAGSSGGATEAPGRALPGARPRCEKAAHPILAISSSSTPAIPSGRDWSCTRRRSGANWGRAEGRRRAAAEDRPGRGPRRPLVSRPDGV